MDKRILCIDDEKDVRDILIKMVTAWGYDIECAGTRVEAFEMFDAMEPFLVITDLRLTDQAYVDGVTIADRLHRQSPLTIFIALSGWVEPDSFDLGYLLGSVFTDVLQKPVNSEVLKSVINYAWEKRQRWEATLNG